KGERGKLSARRTRVWPVQPEPLTGELREIGCDQSRLSEWRADAKHPEARGSKAQADQGECGNAGPGDASRGNAGACHGRLGRTRGSLKRPGPKAKRQGLAMSPAPFRQVWKVSGPPDRVFVVGALAGRKQYAIEDHEPRSEWRVRAGTGRSHRAGR